MREDGEEDLDTRSVSLANVAGEGVARESRVTLAVLVDRAVGAETDRPVGERCEGLGS